MDEQDQLSRHWPCPRCGCIDLYVLVHLERGFEEEDGTFVHFYPPAAYATDVNLEFVRCSNCKRSFDAIEFFALTDIPAWIELDDDEEEEEEAGPDEDAGA
jgi:DNA-directed RNA polymerase subunit RPC12/RpoP